MKPIAHIESLFPEKFGIPRQAGIVDTPARIVFETEYRMAEAVRGLEGFDYIWLVWVFSKHAHLDDDSQKVSRHSLVRPPRLGGNERMGVFATRSPFRPNPIGLSSVRLTRIDQDAELGPVLHIEGADLMDGTPILDIKPYLPYTDSHPEARSGFAVRPAERLLEVECPQELLNRLSPTLRQPLLDLLALDPRPQYHDDPERVYGMAFDRFNIRFRIRGTHVEVVEVLTKS